MAYIKWSQGEEAIINTLLSASGTSPAVPTASTGDWGLGLGAQLGGVWAGQTSVTLALKQRQNGTDPTSTIAEIGQTTPNGYQRFAIVRSTAGWPAATNNGGSSSFQSTAIQASFSFTNPPVINGATLAFIAKSTTVGANDLMFGADLQATRVFDNGDTENVSFVYTDT